MGTEEYEVRLARVTSGDTTHVSLDEICELCDESQRRAIALRSISAREQLRWIVAKIVFATSGAYLAGHILVALS